MALLAFVDDVRFNYRDGGHERRWYGYGGVVLDDKGLPALDKRFQDLKVAYGFPTRLPRTELGLSLESYREAKYNPKRKQWMWDNLKDVRRRSFFQESIAIVSALDGVFLFSFYDESYDGCGPAAAKSRALENLYERINAVAIDQDSSVGIVICDIEGSPSQVRTLVTEATGIARLGTWFQRDLRTHLYPVLLTADSNAHAGLQIADIAMGSLSNMLRKDTLHAPPVWERVANSLYKRGGTARGWGVKIRGRDKPRLLDHLKVD